MSIPDEIAFDGFQFLAKGLPSRKLESMDHSARREWLRGMAVRANRVSREQLYASFATAYATYAQVALDFAFAKLIEEVAGRKVDKRTSLLRLVLEVFIAYGDEDGGDLAHRRATNLYARDVAAARALINSGVPPSRVVELSRTRGEGLDKWARQGISSQKHARLNKSKQSEGTLSVVVRAQTRSSEGKIQVELFKLSESKFTRDLLDSIRRHKSLLERATGGSLAELNCTDGEVLLES